MESWAEIWDIPEVAFPLRMARTREDFDQLAILNFEVEVRGPDSVKLDNGCSIELYDDMHEICFRPKQTGLHQVRIKVDGQDFCPPIQLSVNEDGTVRTSKDKRQRPTRGHHLHGDVRDRHVEHKGWRTSEMKEGREMHRSLSSQSSQSGGSRSESLDYQTSVNYISGKNGQLFVESDGRLVPVKERHGQVADSATNAALMRRSVETRKKTSRSKQALGATTKSSDKHQLYNCTHCNKLIKLKRLLILERKPYCEFCFKVLFMRKGPEQHLEALQSPERGPGFSNRNSLNLSRFSMNPKANLTGLKLKHVKHAQTEFTTFDRHGTGKADRRFLEPLLRACLAQHLSEHKTNEAMMHQNTKQAIIRCGLYGPGEMTTLQFLNILAFAMRERTTKWLAKTPKSKMKRSPLSEPNLTAIPNKTDMFRDGAGSDSKIRATKLVGTLETIPSADDLSSISDDRTLPEDSELADLELPEIVSTGSPIVPNAMNSIPPPTTEERTFGVTHGDSDAWMMY